MGCPCTNRIRSILHSLLAALACAAVAVAALALFAAVVSLTPCQFLSLDP